MPDLYIYQQCKRNFWKILECVTNTVSSIWGWLDKYGTKFSNALAHEVVGRINRKAHKYKKCLRIFAGIVLLLMLITGLFMASFKSVGSREQGLQINYTEEVLKQQYITNDWKYTGLNGYMQIVPKQKMLIEYNKYNSLNPQNDQQQTYQKYPAIQARVIQGTKLLIQTRLQCSIVIQNNNIKGFFQNYGFDKTPGQQTEQQWMTYLRQKTTNIIIQTISPLSFYSVTTTSLKQALNSQFAALYASYKATFPFVIKALTITINYPEGSFPVNNTLGLQLLRAKSVLNQLQGQYQTVNAYTTLNKAIINATYTQNALLNSEIDKGLIGVYNYDKWMQGLSIVSSMLAPFTSTTPANGLQKYIWLYFNNLYNQTYRQQRFNASINRNSNYKNTMLLQQQNIIPSLY